MAVEPNFDPPVGMEALLKTLMLAEMHKRWELYEEVLELIQDGGGRIARFAPYHYVVEHPSFP